MEFADGAEEFEVLHVAGADLDDVGVVGGDFEVFEVEEFGDDGQLVFFARLGEELQGFDAEALEGVRVGARFEGAAAKEVCAGLFDGAGGLVELFGGFDAARSGDDDEVATDLAVPYFDDCGGVFGFATGEVVWIHV